MDTRILVIDFEANELAPLERALRADGAIPLTARDRAEALQQWSDTGPDAVLMAVDGFGTAHRELIRAIRARSERPLPILFFGRGQANETVKAPSDALAQGGDYFFRIPCDLSYLAGRVRAWTERGPMDAGPTAPETSDLGPSEAPEFEGLSSDEGVVRLPALERLREPLPEGDPPWFNAEAENAQAARSGDELPFDDSGWEWVSEFDQSINEPSQFDFAVPSDMPVEPRLSEPEPHPAYDRDPLPSSVSAATNGVGTAEQDALLLDFGSLEEGESDPLSDVRIEEVEELEDDDPEAVLEVPASSPEEIPLPRSNEAPPMPPHMTWGVDETVFLDAQSLPGSDLAIDADEPPSFLSHERSELRFEEIVPEPAPVAPMTFDTLRSPPEEKRQDVESSPGDLRSVAFPTVDVQPSRVLARKPRPSGSRLSEATLEALRALVAEQQQQQQPSPRRAPPEERKDGGPAEFLEHREELNKHSRPETELGDAPAANGPLPPASFRQQAASSARQASDGCTDEEGSQHSRRYLRRATRRTDFLRRSGADSRSFFEFTPDSEEPTLNAESIEELAAPDKAVVEAQPSAPIEDDEDTQELFAAPLLHVSEGQDFPPGALAIVCHAEREREQGALNEACAGYALAAQIYLDHDLIEPAKSLYRYMLRIRPSDPLAARRLQDLENRSSDEPRDEVTLEFEDDGPPRAASAGPPEPFEAEKPAPVRAETFSSTDAPWAPSATADLFLESNALPQPVIGRASNGPSSRILGALRSTSLSPDAGCINSLADSVELFLRVRAQRASGVLWFEGTQLGLFVAHGVPSGLVGDAVMPSFLRFVADLGRISESQARQLQASMHRSPRTLARNLRARGLLGADEENLLPIRHLEDRMVRCLQLRGAWRFEPDCRGLTAEDLVPRVGELREWLIELLSRASSVEELRSVLSLSSETLKIVPGTEHFVPESETPFTTLLDGRRSLEEAARLSGFPMIRGLAWGLVWLHEGLAERTPRTRAGMFTNGRSLRENCSAPTLEDLPRLKPRTNPTSSWPSTFRLEGRSEAKPVPATPTKAETSSPKPQEALAALDDDTRIRRLAELVRTRDYFGILDVDTSATRKTIDDAHRRMRNLIPHDVSSELEAMVREVLRSVDEARDVLMIPELRAAYEHHVEPRA